MSSFQPESSSAPPSTPGIDISTPTPPPPPTPPVMMGSDGVNVPVPIPVPVPVSSPIPTPAPVTPSHAPTEPARASAPAATPAARPEHVAPAAPVLAAGAGGTPSRVEPTDDDPSSKRGVLLAAGAAALVGILGVGAFVFVGSDSDDRSVISDAAPADEVAPAAEPAVDEVIAPDADDVAAGTAVPDTAAPDTAAPDTASAGSVSQDAVAEETVVDADEPAVVVVDQGAVVDGDEPVAVDPGAVADVDQDSTPVADSAADPAADPVVDINDIVSGDQNDEVDSTDSSVVGDVAESKATIRNGQIFFEGAVPSQEVGEEIAGLAIEILGPDNVFNNYVVDPDAGDPDFGNITVEDTITFEPNSALLDDPNNPLLAQGAALMSLRPAMTVTIVGHTDSRGTPEVNERLSLERAESVKAFFVDLGIAPERLTTRGAGPREPIASNDTVEGRAENRRIQFFLENVLGEG